MNVVLKLKLSAQEFGELCNSILDAFERGEAEIPTKWGLALVGHIEAVYKEQAVRDNSMATMAIDIDNAQNALSRHGVSMPPEKSIGTGIEELYLRAGQQWQQYAAYCRSCAMSGESPDSFEQFIWKMR